MKKFFSLFFWILFLLIADTNINMAENTIVTENEIHKLVKFYLEWADQARTWQEGYQNTLAGTEITYHSPVPGVNKAMLTRATDGKMTIEWETAIVPTDFDDEFVTFILLAGIGCNLGEQKFDLYFNAQKWFTFSSSNKDEWTIKGNHDSELYFKAVSKDGHHDLFGYLFVKIPSRFIVIEKPQHIRVVGDNAGSNAWFMIFTQNNVVEQFRQAADACFWYQIVRDDKKNLLMIKFPLNWAGKVLQLSNQASFNQIGTIQPVENAGQVIFTLSEFNDNLFPIDLLVHGEKLDRVQSWTGKPGETEIYSDGLLILRSRYVDDGIAILECSGSQLLSVTGEIFSLSQSNFSDAVLHLITSSHQDIAWMDSPQKCIEDRDKMIISPALELLKKDSTYHYSVEQALMLKEYLERHPEKKQEILQYTREGRLEWGATFNQPYEGMYSGESLVRQLYSGRKWLKQVLPGCDSRLAWNVDVPGRTRQMPQILCKGGVHYMMISRHEQGLFYWQSPDGSRVGVYSPGHYHHATQFMRNNDFEIMASLPQFINEWWPLYEKYHLPGNIPLLISTDMGTPRDYSELMTNWNHIRIHSKDQKSLTAALPRLHYDIAETFFDQVFAGSPELPVIMGERPNLWLYIHGPTHHHALTAAREAARLLTAAEKFSTIEALLANSFDNYPTLALTTAWESQIYPDHGWGGKNGHITDSVFQKKFEYARDEGQRLLNQALNKIASQVKIKPAVGIPVIVFNDLSWRRSDPVTAKLDFARGETFAIHMVDAQNNSIPIELFNTDYFNDGSIRATEFIFIANAIPAIGYKTFYLQTTREKARTTRIKNNIRTFENDFYRIDFTTGGIEQIYDKQLQQALFNSEKFLVGELFTMRSEGNGAGEFARVQQPTMAGFDRLSNYNCQWRLLNDGTVSSTFMIEQKLPHCKYRQKVTLFKTVKRIDFAVALLAWDGTKYREYRLAFPLNMKNARVTYEVPFGVVQVGQDEIPGAAGERYTQPAAEVRPREVQDWMGASDENFALTMSSSVAVCDYSDPTDDPVDYPVIQPVLLASRKSCHSEGNWYLQPGDHYYNFSISSHHPGWENGYHTGKQANHPLYPVFQTTAGTILPEEKSFCSISAGNVMVSTIKKCEDDTHIIIRLFEAEGKDTDAAIQFFHPLKSVELTNIIEEEGVEIPTERDKFSAKFGHHAIETFKILWEKGMGE